MHRIAFALALATSCLTPVAAMAQDTGSQQPEGTAAQATEPVAAAPETAAPDKPEAPTNNEITLGTQWVRGSNTGLFGRYNGQTFKGVDLIAGFRFTGRDPGDSGNTFYYDVRAVDLLLQTGRTLRDHFGDHALRHDINANLGPESSIDLRIGNQGIWGLDAGYNAITYTGNIINSIYTVNGTTGVLNNGLLAYGGATNSPLVRGPVRSFTTATLSPAERLFATGTRRDIFHLDGKYQTGHWTIAAGVRHEHKDGRMEQSLRMNYAGVAFTMPVDYDTDRFDISAAYNTPRLQAALQFNYSRFRNGNLAVTMPYPVSISTLTASSGPYAQAALYSLPPDNSALYLTGMLGYNFTPRTRLTVNGRVGLELQNDTFPANSADPNLSNTLGNPTFHWFDNLNAQNQGTTANSPHDRALIYQGNIALDSRLTEGIDGRVSYSFDGRHVHLNQFRVWIGGPSPDATANTAVFVVPQNWFRQTAKVELTYHLRRASNTKLLLNYSYNQTHRANAQVANARTNTGSAQLSSMLGKSLMGRLTYEHADRSGKIIYGTAWGHLEEGEPDTFGTPSGAYYLVPMTSDSVTARLDIAPAGKLSGGLFLKYTDERFHYSKIPNNGIPGDWNLVGHGEGVKRDYNFTVGPDLTWRPQDGLDFHAFYTYERIFFDNRGNGACAESTTGLCAGSAGYFQNKYTNSVHTAGLDAQWQATPKLKLSADYAMSFGSVMFGEFNGVTVPVATVSYQNVVPYPDIKSRLYDLNLTADYKIARNVEWALMYRFSRFHNNDWNDFAAPVQPTLDGGTTISILTPGYPPPRYNVSVLGTAFRLRF